MRLIRNLIIIIIITTCHRLTESVDEIGAADFAVDLALDDELRCGVGEAGERQQA